MSKERWQELKMAPASNMQNKNGQQVENQEGAEQQ